MQLETHLTFPVGTSEHDRNIWMGGLNPAASARDAMFCSNVDVKPTMAY